MDLSFIKSTILNLGNWIRALFYSLAVGSHAQKKADEITKTTTTRALFLTSDRGLFGIDEELWAIVNPLEDVCIIEGLDRLFFGNKKTGIVTYTTRNGQKYAICSDGHFQVLDHTDFNNGKFKSKALKLNDIQNLDDILKALPKDKQKELEDILNTLSLKKLGVCLDLNLADDHKDSKDLTVWAFKAMSGGFFKSLSQFPLRIIIIIALCAWFLGISMTFIGIFLILIMLFLLWLLLH